MKDRVSRVLCPILRLSWSLGLYVCLSWIADALNAPTWIGAVLLMSLATSTLYFLIMEDQDNEA